MDPSSWKLPADAADVGLGGFSPAFHFPSPHFRLLKDVKDRVALPPEFSTSQMSERNDLIPAQQVGNGRGGNVCFV